MADTWRIELLGPLRALRGEQVVERFPTRKTGLLLARLAVEPDRPQTRESLIEHFWPESAPGAGRNSLSRALSGLRRLFERTGEPGTVFVTDRYHVALAPKSVETDVAALRSTWDRAKGLDPEQSEHLDALRAAVALYRGELLPGAEGDWVEAEREALARLHLRVLGRLVERLLHDGAVREAIEVAHRAVEADPLREPAHRDLMRALAADGRPAEVVRQYRSLETLLADELGVAPSEETQELVATLRSPSREGGEPATGKRNKGAAAEPDHPRSAMSPASRGAVVPSGTITVLALRQDAAGASQEEVAAFLRGLSRGLRGLDGVVIKPGVEETLAVFAQASDAAAAAQVAVREASTHNVALRAGLHTGEAGAEGGDDASPVGPVARALAGIARAGQVILSEEAAILARPALEGDDRLVDLGRFTLTVETSPERLFHLRRGVRGHTAADAALPVTITPAQTSRLPVRLSRFIGREEERATLLAMLDDPGTRLVTVTGMGGTGKTRVATEVAAAWERKTGRATIWVELDAVDDARTIGAEIAEAMGIAAPEAYDAMQLVRRQLGADDGLLVLDNFEQLVEEGSLVVRELLAGCPRLTAMATSRARLGLEGEREFALRPLPMPEGALDPDSLADVPSVRLFLDRARATHPDFALSPSNAEDVARLCVALEGIPLAIELAAARVGVLGTRQMLARLSDRLQWLAARRVDLGDRQRSLRGAIDWSYTLLSPDTRADFAAVSVFRGSWDLEAAEALMDDPLAVERMAELRDASLIGADPTDDDLRFSMLEAVRIFAAEKLDEEPDRTQRLRAAHAAHFATLAETAAPALMGPDQRVWLERLSQDDDNFTAALDWCVSAVGDTATGLRLVGGLNYYWFTRGYLRAGLESTVRLLDKSDASAEPELEIGALRVAGGLAAFLEERAVAAPYLERALALQEEHGEPFGIATTRYQLAVLAHGMDDMETAYAHAKLSARGFRNLDDPRAERGMAAALNMLGLLAMHRGDMVEAKDHLEHGLKIVRAAGDQQGAKHVLDNLAHIATQTGELDTATEHVREATRIALDLGNEWGVLKTISLSAAIQVGRANYTEAARLLGAGETHRLRIDPPHAAEYAATHERLTEILHEKMGPDALEPALREGRAWDWDAVVRVVLGDGG